MFSISNICNDYNVLHEIPEEGYKEIKTKNYIIYRLNNNSYIRLLYSGKHGLIYEYKGNESEIVDIAFRAEMDAVEIDTNNNIFYHSCGHDAHMSILISVIEYINETLPIKNLVFIFQASEEKYGGAYGIVQQIQRLGLTIQSLLGLHVTPDLFPGLISCNSGKIMASIACTKINISKKNYSHTSISDNSLLKIFERICNEIEEINKETNNSQVLITNFFSDGSHNVQPKSLSFNLSIRTINNDEKISVFKKTMQKIESKLTSKETISYSEVLDYPYVYNDFNLYKKFRMIFYDKNFILKTPFMMSGDDISLYYEHLKIPTLYIFIGCYSKKSTNLHSSEFVVPEQTMKTGLYVLLKSLELE